MEEQSIIDAMIAQGKYSLWHPTSKGDLLMDYPELRKVKQFMDVDNASKMLFVWFYACRTSRARELVDDKMRIRYAIRAAWGERPPRDIERDYLEKKWGRTVEDAIEKMRSYQPEPRILQKLLASQQIQRVQKMLEADVTTVTTWKDKDDYFAATKAGFALIAQLSPLTEFAALGVVEKTEEQEEHEGSVMEWLHKQRSSK